MYRNELVSSFSSYNTRYVKIKVTLTSLDSCRCLQDLLLNISGRLRFKFLYWTQNCTEVQRSFAHIVLQTTLNFYNNSNNGHTSSRAKGVLSFSGRCSSRANTMQFAMIVISTIYSNGVQTNSVKAYSHCDKFSNDSRNSCCNKFFIYFIYLK